MPKGKEPFSLKNMNGISHDDTRSCALSDMNCRRGQPDACLLYTSDAADE